MKARLRESHLLASGLDQVLSVLLRMLGIKLFITLPHLPNLPHKGFSMSYNSESEMLESVVSKMSCRIIPNSAEGHFKLRTQSLECWYEVA